MSRSVGLPPSIPTTPRPEVSTTETIREARSAESAAPAQPSQPSDALEGGGSATIQERPELRGESLSEELKAQLTALRGKLGTNGADKAARADVDITINIELNSPELAEAVFVNTARTTSGLSIDPGLLDYNINLEIVNELDIFANAQNLINHQWLKDFKIPLTFPISDNIETSGQDGTVTDQIIDLGNTGNSTGLKKTFSSLMNLDQLKNMPIDALVQLVLRESYMETTYSLRDYAAKVRFYNTLKAQIRERTQLARNVLSSLPPGAEDGYRLDPPHQTDKINTEFTGLQSVDGTIQSGTMTAEQRALLEEEQRKQAEYERLRTQWEGADRVTESRNLTISGGPSRASYDSDGKQIGRGALREVGQDYIQQFMEWFEGLSEAEQLAILEHFTIDAEAHEKSPGAWNEGEVRNCGLDVAAPSDGSQGDAARAGLVAAVKSGSMDVSQAMEQALQGALEHAIDIAFQGADTRDIFYFNFGVNVPPGVTYDAEVPPPKPDEMLKLEEELGIINETVSGQWAEGMPCMTKAQLENYIKHMEEKLNTVGEDAQLANVDLQNWLQKQQQLIQTLTNVSKLAHDIAMAVARNIS